MGSLTHRCRTTSTARVRVVDERRTAEETVRGSRAHHGQRRAAGLRGKEQRARASWRRRCAPGRSTIANVPEIQDVTVMAELLGRVGCEVDYSPAERGVVIGPGGAGPPGRLRPRAGHARLHLVLGPLMARCRRAEVALPGGDAHRNPGSRHAPRGSGGGGAELGIEHGLLHASTPEGLPRFFFRSVTPRWAPRRIFMTAATTAGVPRAGERGAGADRGHRSHAARPSVHSRGTGHHHTDDRGCPAEPGHAPRTVPDRIMAGTWAFAAAVTGGRVQIRGAEPSHLGVVLDELRRGVRRGHRGGPVHGPGPQPTACHQRLHPPVPGFHGSSTDVVALNAMAEVGIVAENARGPLGLRRRARAAGAPGRAPCAGGRRGGLSSPGARGGHGHPRGRCSRDGRPHGGGGVTEVSGIEHIDRGLRALGRHLARTSGVQRRIHPFRG
ncbi:UDP-N-acetylglucosamine 1-carboxyvinyltransferase [Kocuria rhizophila]|nr:UDP-N-acetylglucosamine 1-carboxyvinyltransferase [Kocuria rhizophila]